MSLRREAEITESDPSRAGDSESEPSRAGYKVERGFSAAFELVATPALFGLIGFFLDDRLGTGRILTIALPVFVAGYLIWKLWYHYNAEMVRLETELIGRRGGRSYGTEI